MRKTLLGISIFLALIIILILWPPFATDSRSSKLIIVIDAGHGGKDPGTFSISGIPEKEINLQIARILEIKALNDPDIEIVLTRRDDRFIPLRERTEIANRLGAALYISIHSNAHPTNRGVRGVETLIHEDRRSPNFKINLALANIMQRNLIVKLDVRDRGVKWQPLYIRWAKMPAILIEVGFVTNPYEEARLRTLRYQGDIADAILDGIKAFVKKY